MNILQDIRNHEDMLRLDADQRKLLCDQIRQFLVKNVSQTGGHVASNLGVVELTVAIETVYNTEIDRLIFDVGHQSYVHKMLTGRQAAFKQLRQYGGIAGFPKPSESLADAFVAGHASSSVSIALGMARARTLQGEDYDVVVVMGDGAATGGLAYEGLNDAAVSGEPIVIILNDNNLSIDHNVGGMASHLRKLRTKERYLGIKDFYKSLLSKFPGGKAIYTLSSRIKNRVRRILIPSTIFENMGFTYLGPVDGHDTEELIALLKTAKRIRKPVIIHVLTQKGRGYKPSEEHPKLFHGIGKFDPDSGIPLGGSNRTYSGVFGDTMVRLAENNHRICAVTAAMPGGTGLLDFKRMFPKRLFDVGIAEEHAVSMAGGLAKQGMIPVVALYSTFLQRSYDMIMQDVGILGLHVVFAVDRAGLVGEDGETHHGVFDVSLLRSCPGMMLLAPGSTQESADMLEWAINECSGPVAVRYPRGGDGTYHDSAWVQRDDIEKTGALFCHENGTDAAIITYGSLLDNALDASHLLKAQGVEISVIRLLTLSPLPEKQLTSLVHDIHNVVILEECTRNCGVHTQLEKVILQANPNTTVTTLCLGDGFVTHGKISELYHECGLDPQTVAKHILEVHYNEN